MRPQVYEEIERRSEKKSQLASQYKGASIAYGLFFCIVGIVLNTIEPFKTCSSCNTSLKIFIESFYIYLYAVSILVIILMCYFIIRSTRELKVSIKHGSDHRRLSLAPKNKKEFPAKTKFLLDKIKSSKLMRSLSSPEKEDERLEKIDEEHLVHEHSPQSSPTQISVPRSLLDGNKFDFTYDYENGTGELYMRCGTAIFSICSMIEICLNLIQMLEAYINHHEKIEECRATFIVTIISKFLGIIFVLSQSFFIFKYANIVINYGKNSAFIYLMHLVCTNVCVTLRAVVYETVSEIQHHTEHVNSLHFSVGTTTTVHHKMHHIRAASSSDHHSIIIKNSTSSSASTKSNEYICINSLSFESTGVLAGVQEAEQRLSPYLYPCIIEYSLMSMTVLFILWESIETKFNKMNSRRQSNVNILDISPTTTTSRGVIFHQHGGNTNQQNPDGAHANHFIVDCGKSTTGLFIGLVVLLMTLISLITYYIYKNINIDVARIICKATEICLICLSMIVVAVIVLKLKYYKFQQKFADDMNYNEILIIVGLGGIYIYSGFSIVAILNSGLDTYRERISLTIQIISVIESSFQSILIINCLKMFSKNIQNKKNKPARSSIILLILIDVSLWVLETFSIKKYDMNQIQLDYYDIVFWSIVSSISAPFAIFFRFHASVCLSDIWKTLYE